MDRQRTCCQNGAPGPGSCEGELMLRALGVTAGALLLGIGAFAADSAARLGVFTDIEPSHFDGSCKPVAGAAGAEDLTVDPRSGIVYVSAYDRVASDSGK